METGSPVVARASTGAGRRRRPGGFTYLGLLVFLSVMASAAAATGVVFHQQAQREKEKDLLFAGDQIQRAIASYYENSPNGTNRFPPSLDALVQDHRFPVMRRHLRRLYRDPMTGTTDWGVLRAQDGGIIGVYSNSNDRPVKLVKFPPGYEDFKGRTSYRDWKFIYPVGYAFLPGAVSPYPPAK